MLDTWRLHLMAAASSDDWRTMDYGFNMWDFNASYGYDYQNQHVKQGMKAYISDRVESLENQLYYSGEEPFIYDVIASHQTIVQNDTFILNVSAFGPEGIDDVIFHYRSQEGLWETITLQYNPIVDTKKVEESDLYTTQIIMEFVGNYEWYLTAIYNGDVERFPVYGYKTLSVIDPVVSTHIQINELLAKNDNINSDYFGEFDDWIELYNTHTESIVLDGYYLTDNISNLTQWSFPISDIVIEPNEFLIVWTDNDDEQGDLHTNFKLSASGEFIALVSPDESTIIDSITFGQQTADISFGRVENDQDVWAFLFPTPGAINQPLNLDENNHIAKSPMLGYPFPNPFNPIVDVPLIMGKKEHVQISIHNILGEHIIDLVNGVIKSGNHNIQWNGVNEMNEMSPSGIYFVVLKTESRTQSQKLLFVQ